MRWVLGLALCVLASCHAADAPNRPEEVCLRACGDRLAQCSEAQCLHGCRVALDRLVEHEGDRVLLCVADAKPASCEASTWADCAVKVGAHADGGPPLPPAREDEDHP
jgi:hypothetical protein